MDHSVRSILEKIKTTASIAGEAAGRTLDSAGKKAGEMWEITRMNLQISELHSDINKIFVKIGDLVYRAHLDPNTDTECVDEMLAAVDEKKATIRDIQDRIAALKQLKLCKRCSQTLSLEDKFCRFCGASMEDNA